MKLTIPIPEKVSLNKIYAGIHFRKRSEHKDAYYVAVLAARTLPYVEGFPAHFHYHFRLRAPALNITNHAYMVKLLEDGLVHVRVIPADTQSFVGAISITAEKIDRCYEEVVVEISPCPQVIH